MDNFTGRLLEEIIHAFRLKGKLVYYDALISGNINDTYTVITDYGGSPRQYLVQRLNHHVFREPIHVAENIIKVTAHIQEKLYENGVHDVRRRVIKLYTRPDGSYYFITPDGDYWRTMSYVFDSETHDTADTPEMLRAVGDAFGEFQMYLSDFDASTLFITIPDFHNTEKRFAAMREAAERNENGRLKDVREEYDYLMSMSRYASFFREKHEKGEIPLRVTHNDTKCNNVMFDSFSNEPLAVIDLDTVMPGFVAHDFGDAVRFAANPGGEDGEDLSRIRLDMDLFVAFASGFVPRINGAATRAELETLPEGVLCITLELAARFLTDYLDGDKYFKCKKPFHNLIRTRAQTALAKDIYAKLPKMRDELGKMLKK